MAKTIIETEERPGFFKRNRRIIIILVLYIINYIISQVYDLWEISKPTDDYWLSDGLGETETLKGYFSSICPETGSLSSSPWTC